MSQEIKLTFFSGEMNIVLHTPKVITFTISRNVFICFAFVKSKDKTVQQPNKNFKPLMEILQKYNGQNLSLSLPILNLTQDKKIIVTNHTKISFEETVLFYPVEFFNQEKEKEQFINESIQKAQALEERHIQERKIEKNFNCPHCGKIIIFTINK